MKESKFIDILYNSEGEYTNSFLRKLFIRLSVVLIISCILSTGLILVLNGFTNAIFFNLSVCLLMAAVLLVALRTNKYLIGTWFLVLINGVFQFPLLAFLRGTSMMPYFIMILVTITFISADRHRNINFGITLFIYVIFFCCCYKFSPAWKNISKMGIHSAIITFLTVSLVIFFFELLFLRMFSQLNGELVEKNKSKSDFIASVSHEIRTPVNGIIGMNEMILRESDQDVVKQYANDAKTSGKVLLDLINEILDLSKIEAGKMDIIASEYDTKEIVQKLATVINDKAVAKSLIFNCDIDKNLPSKLYGDDLKLVQITLNLLSNAVKYTSKGSVTLKMSYRMVNSRFYLQVSVKDTGRGLSDKEQKDILEAYKRLDGETTRSVEGTGLGLNLTEKLLQLMGSRLQIESEVGKGSTFFYEIEQEIIDEAPIGDWNIVDEEKIEAVKQQFIAPNAHVLVVDDNNINRKTFNYLLKRTKIQIDSADSGYKCLKYVKDKKYDLIFLDHQMTNMDGIETIKQIQAMGDIPSKDTPIVAFTANAGQDNLKLYEESGFASCLIKPVDPLVLDNMLLKYLPDELIQLI